VSLPRPVSLWLPVLLWAGLIFGVSGIPSLNSGLGTLDEILRKSAHVTEYALLALLLWRAVRDDGIAFFGTVLYAVTDEFHQSFVFGRKGAPRDVVFDAIGAFLALLILRPELER
jgi:VanZ family protein